VADGNELILRVRRVGGHASVNSLRGLFPLLGSLVLHALLKVSIALFRKALIGMTTAESN